MSSRGDLDPQEAGDWARYGGAGHRPGGPEPEELPKDDPFVTYRYENGLPPAQEGGPPRRHTPAHLLGVLAGVLVVAAAATTVNLLVPREGPGPTPSRTPRPVPTAPRSPLISVPRPTQRE